MANKFRRLPQADADLEGLWLFIATENEKAADALLDRIGRVFQMLLDNPQAGRERPDLLPGIRSFAVASYTIFYTADAHAVTIVRILHGARDISPDDIAE